MADSREVAHTRSYCPSCLRVIDASVIERGGRLYLDKTCPVHGNFIVLHAMDVPAQYHAMRRIFCAAPWVTVKPRDLIIYITARCDQQCPVCYNDANRRSFEEPTIVQILAKLKGYEGEYVHLSGGEPTMREDLVAIIRAVKRRGFKVGIFSNGRRLSSWEYVQAVKAAGADLIILQFDSLRDSDTVAMRGEALVSVKLAAFENLRRARLPVYLFSVLLEGVTLDQIKPLFQFAIANADIVKILNFNPLWSIGRCSGQERASHTLIFREIERQIGLSLDDFLACTELSHYFFELYARFFRRFLGEDWVRQPPCAQRIYLLAAPQGAIPVNRLIDMPDAIRCLRRVLGEGEQQGVPLKPLLCLVWIGVKFLCRKQVLQSAVDCLISRCVRVLRRPFCPHKFWTDVPVVSMMVGTFFTKFDIDLALTAKCTLYADLPGENTRVCACIRQILYEESRLSGRQAPKKVSV